MMTEQQDQGPSFEAFAEFIDGLQLVGADVFWEACKRITFRMQDQDKWLGIALRMLSAMRLKSPIEGIFRLQWMASEREDPTMAYLYCAPNHSMSVSGELIRPDFLVVPDTFPYGSADGNEFSDAFSAAVVVELDGHDFHERTKDQVRARNRKDRLIQSVGWAVCHFSGSEVVGDPQDCVRQVVVLAKQRGQIDVGLRAAARRAADAGKP